MLGVDRDRWQEAVFAAMRNTGMTMRDLAKDAGYNSTYFYVCKGRDTDPNAFMLKYICEKSGMSADYILGLTNVPARSSVSTPYPKRSLRYKPFIH